MLLKDLLLESKFDSHALDISREIVNAFKRDKTFKQFYELNRAGEKAEFTVTAKFFKMPNLEYSHSVTGGGDADELDVYIHYNPSSFPAAMNDLVAEIKETVVHELEHVGQQNFEDMFIVKGKKYSNYIEYLTSNIEVPAYVKGLIKRAKTKGITLDAAMDEWRKENNLNFVGPATRWEDVKPVWMKWAQVNKDKIKKFT